jgi:hypothetical protein
MGIYCFPSVVMDIPRETDPGLGVGLAVRWESRVLDRKLRSTRRRSRQLPRQADASLGEGR